MLDVCFFNHQDTRDGSAVFSSDDRTGLNPGKYGNESIKVFLDSISPRVVSLLYFFLRTILKLKDVATALSEGEFNQKIELNRDDEVGELAKAFNSMAFQLQNSFNLLTLE